MASNRINFVCIMLLLSGPALAFNATGLIWQQGKTEYKTRLFNNSGETTFRNAFGEALDIWSNNSTFQYEIDSSTSADPCNNSLANGISMATTSCGAAFGASVLAVHSALLVNNVRTRSRIVFNSNVNWGVFNGPIGGQIDFRRTAVHELGHGLGLGHANGVGAIMEDTIGSIEVPATDDLNGVASMYDLDSDGIGFANDNCPDDVNAGQEDFDFDGEGDECDADIDGDGVFNSAVIDQNFSTSNLDSNFFFFGGTGGQFAQTFTVGVTGVLDQVSLPVFCPSGNMQIAIRTVSGGSPTNTVLDSVTFSNTSNQGFVDIDLGGVAVTQGEQFAIVASSSTGNGNCRWIRSTISGYAGGAIFFTFGSSFGNPLAGGEDLPFSTRVNPSVIDNCPTVPNPTQEPSACNDGDGDGIFNGLDNCEFDPNPDQLDFDGDGEGDVCDLDIDGDSALNPNDSDNFDRFICSDDDADSCDDCSLGTFNVNNDGTDTDSNGICNLTDPDDDGDGVLDGTDNCPINSNPLQEDSNMDGVGDACEPGMCIPVRAANGKLAVICL